MNDYLNMGMEDAPQGGDYPGDDGGYLGLETQPAPAGDPYGNTAGGYLAAEPQSAPAGGYLDAPAEQGYGDQGYVEQHHYASHDQAGTHAYGNVPAMPAAPANPSMNELSVQAPYLEEVQPNPATVGGARGDLSSLVLDVEVPVEVFFGDAALTVEEFLELGPGSVVELDRPIEAPVELRVRGKLVARGQLVTINGAYGLRITDMVERH